MKIYSTKYCLHWGIMEVKGEIVDGELFSPYSAPHSYLCGKGVEWHRTREGAVVWAKDMQRRKLVSLRKKITKIEKLTFEE